jgi:hypothetical protein
MGKINNLEAAQHFSRCLEELRLLIENPCEHDVLIERLSAIKNSLERFFYLYFFVE